MENQTKYLFYGLSRNSQNPLDPRLKISSLANINDELPINNRYSGLIFHITDINKLYLFLNDLNNPIDFQTFLTNGQIYGIFNISADYGNLINLLNTTNPTLGNLVTVYPLNVTFIFNGINWEYFSGNYNVIDDVELNSIPLELRKENKLILMGLNNYIFKADLTKSDVIISLNDFPSTLENNRYYSINGILYLSLMNNLYKLSENFIFFQGHALSLGNNIITHNLNSTYISALIWINNITTEINEIFDLKVKIVDNNEINILSEFNITGNLLITSKF